MDVVIMDSNFKTIYVIDDYISLLWVERYYEAGEFELYMAPRNEKFISDMSEHLDNDDAYFKIKDSDRVMILDSIDLTTDPEVGGRFKLTGKSLETILDRRLYWGGFNLWESQELSSFLWYCLYFNVTNPSDASRKIPNFRFSENNWPVMGESVMTITKEYLSETIYEMISEQCKYNEYGFKILLTESSDNHYFDFVLYKGVDRTAIKDNPAYVVVSPKYDNLSESNFLKSNTDYKNVTLIEAKGQAENERIFKTKSAYDAKFSGLERREIFTDARNISWDKADYNTIDSSESNKDKPKELLSNAEFQNLMFEAGKATIKEHDLTVAFEGVIEPNVSFVYGEDYDLGDLIYIVDRYDYEGRSRITEVTKSYDDSGRSISFTLESK